MAIEMQLPCDGAGVCMRCKVKPPSEESLSCNTCATPWHVSCLTTLPESLASTQDWQCPDCSGDAAPVNGAAGIESDGSVLVAAIRAIEADGSLSEAEKAKKRQQLMSGKADDDAEEKGGNMGVDNDVLAVVGENLKCSICIQLLERPVTTPCGHNFCLKCFKKWVGQGKYTCVKCRRSIPKRVARKPLINYVLVSTIRLATYSRSPPVITPRPNHSISNENRPEKSFTTERAKKNGKANACSGKIFVTIPSDHFGPITAEYDPIRNTGVLVGEVWPDRQDCRQWGVHFIPVGGIAGQSKYGAQSVVLSGGYEDDEDHGEWILYTGSGGRDLSGNKRTNSEQSFDQTFRKGNEALRLSCQMGYPVRVIRSRKAEHSAYAPKEGLRYDGVYRIEKCWSKVGIQGFMVCRYLFVRCDNEPAPWTSGGSGDRPRSLPNIPELKKAVDLFERQESPSWDFDEAEGRWKWMKAPPASRKAFDALDSEERKSRRKAKANSTREKLLKELSCQLCRKLMSLPVTTPCAHNFCKACLEAKFAGISEMRERNRGGRTLRAQKNVMTCPCCVTDLSEFLQNPQVNIGLMDVIEKLKEQETKPAEDIASSSENNTTESNSGADEGEEETQMVVSEAEPPMKKMKLDVETVAATATV